MKQRQNNDPAQVPRRRRAAGVGEDALAQGAGAFARAGFTDPGLVLRWAEIAGREVARVAQPVRFQEGADGGVLTLRCVPGATVLLQHETRALIARINSVLGARRVGRLRLLTGSPVRIPAPPPHPSAGRNPVDSGPPANLNEALARLGGRRRFRKPGGN
jgi:hypothetical protein